MAHTTSFNKLNSADTEVTPVVTAGAYTAGNVMGGVMQFPDLLPEDGAGLIQSIALKFKASVGAGTYQVCIFTAQPTGTYTDKAAPVWNAADSASLVGIYTLPACVSPLGTHGFSYQDLYGRQITGQKTGGQVNALWAVVICNGTPTPASTSDMSLRIGVMW